MPVNEYNTNIKCKYSFNSSAFVSGSGFCYYLGVLLFANYLQELKRQGLHVFIQWLIVILLGIKNIEQSKTLDYNSLNVILGSTIPNLHRQRQELKSLASEENTWKLLEFNASLIKANHNTDFYFDPHVKHYTGQLKILKGWCPKIRMADKVLNMDFIHTVKGYPVYFKTVDNFYDLRERYTTEFKEFRKLSGIVPEKVLTFIIDRGIFSMEVFENIINSENLHIITWEKGYIKDGWRTGIPINKASIIKTRNNSRDLKEYHYQYKDYLWEKDERLRKLVVRITNPKGKIIEVSILTDDHQRQAEQIIKLMFSRWIQENDFKYLIKHFGINEITSYRWFSYKELENKIEDKQAITATWQAIGKEVGKLRIKLKTQLLKQHSFNQKIKGKRGKLSPKQVKYQQILKDNIQLLTLQYKEKKQEMSETEKKRSKLQQLIEADVQRLDTNVKSLMDTIKIIARNIFYLTFQSFKLNYDNHRDDHVVFRNLSQSHGFITFNSQKVTVELYPTMQYPPKLNRMIADLLEKINSKQPVLPDNSNRVIHLKLKDKIDSFFASAI